ncbi:FAD-dependent monooxygenase [Kushneria aurantia]|uniref:FAD-dependent monooxygenase n=1 Tax=Kushneria aurantia TaxID=504092 RepID=A0ABV6G1J2_9GAMM|nr:FAD-dependent monooxygenase [Kushneria aurantia]
MAHSDTQRFDIVINGGGIVGLTLAARLAGRTDYRIAVLDADAAPSMPDDALTLRTTSLNAASLTMLEQAGVMDHLPARFMTDFDHIEAGSRDNPAALAFSAEEIDRERFGVFVENDRLRTALWQRLAECERISLIEESAIAELERDEQRVRAELENGRQLEAALIVGADGARSRLRHLAGIASHQRDYAQEALAVNVRLSESPGHTSWQVFTSSGPLALLPLHERQASLIWYDSPTQTRRRAALDDDALIHAIEDAFPERLGGVEAIIGRGHFPIRRLHACRYVDQRLALIGDAAHVIHPLAGQGVNLGMQDARVLADEIENADAPGDSNALNRYQRRQRPRNGAMLLAVEQLHYLYTRAPAPLRELAERGLAGANHFTHAKRLLMSIASGESPRR